MRKIQKGSSCKKDIFMGIDTHELTYRGVHSHFVTIICSPLSRQWDRLPIGTGHSSVLLYKTTAA